MAKVHYHSTDTTSVNEPTFKMTHLTARRELVAQKLLASGFVRTICSRLPAGALIISSDLTISEVQYFGMKF